MPRLYGAEQLDFWWFCDQKVVQCPVYMGLNNYRGWNQQFCQLCNAPSIWGWTTCFLWIIDHRPVVQCPVYMGLNNEIFFIFLFFDCSCAMPRLYGAEQHQIYLCTRSFCCAMPRLYGAEQRNCNWFIHDFELCNAPSIWGWTTVVELISLTKFMLCNAPSIWGWTTHSFSRFAFLQLCNAPSIWGWTTLHIRNIFWVSCAMPRLYGAEQLLKMTMNKDQSLCNAPSIWGWTT